MEIHEYKITYMQFINCAEPMLRLLWLCFDGFGHALLVSL